MMFRNPLSGFAVAALLACVMGGPSAPAGDDRLDVDLDSLDAEVRLLDGRWELRVEYEVEIEDCRPGDEFELLLQVTECGRVLCDADGQPITVAVALASPTDVDDDELEFEDSVTLTLARDLIRNPKRLRIVGVVVRAGSDRPLDRKTEQVEFERK